MTTLETTAAEVASEREKNWVVARRINRETRASSESLYNGKYIGVLNQEVVTVGDSLVEVCDAMKAMDGEASKECCVIEANADYDAKMMFWSWG